MEDLEAFHTCEGGTSCLSYIIICAIESRFDLGHVNEIRRKFSRYKLNYEVRGDLKRDL